MGWTNGTEGSLTEVIPASAKHGNPQLKMSVGVGSDQQSRRNPHS
jgi:hypothetical protein